FYKKQGIEVIINEVANTESTNVVVNGDADFGIANSDILVSRINGAPVVLLATVFQHSPFVFVTLSENSTLNVHNFAGKKVMLEPHAAELQAYLKYDQVPLESMKFLPHNYKVEKLLSKEVFAMSAYLTDELYVLDSLKIGYNVFNPRAGGIDFFGDVLFTSEKVLRENPELVRKFVNASMEGWKYAFEHENEIIELIYNRYSKRRTLNHLYFEARQMKQLVMPDVVEIGYINKQRWQRIGEIYADLNLIPANFNLDGFFYEDNEKFNYVVIYVSLIAAVLLLIISVIAFRFYKLSTNLKKESVQKKLREEQLVLLEKQYRDLVDYAPYPIIIHQMNSGKVLYINQLACEKFEVSRTIAVNLFNLGFFSNRNLGKSIAEQIRNRGFIRNVELELQTAHESKFWAVMSAVQVQFNGENAVFCAVLDISERIEMENELRKLNSTKDKFFSIIAHDLRGPVSTLSQFLNYAVAKFDSMQKSDLQQYLNRLNDVASNTYTLLENLLIWASMQKNELKLQLQLNNLNILIQKNIELLQPTADQKNVRLNLLPSNKVVFNFDANLFETVIRNLVSNAIKYSYASSVIEITLSETQSTYEFSVKDYGIGMHKEVADSLFDISSKNSSQKGTAGETGTGLGLILCYDFVQLHRGVIEVDSKFGEGTKFTVRLPK
ncbi:MAG TPA: hypothetical protein DCQ31_05735, partial [Bacteroidales bacterium]|nr:hypothetical protein [Bacteroidales bacterium]